MTYGALSDGVVVSTWEDTQNVVARHHFHHVDEVVQTQVSKADYPDLFDIGELDRAICSMAQEKAPGHVGFSTEIIHEIFQSLPIGEAFILQSCLKESWFPRNWKRVANVYFQKREDIRAILLPTVLFLCFWLLERCCTKCVQLGWQNIWRPVACSKAHCLVSAENTVLSMRFTG